MHESKRTNEQTNKRTNERTNKQTNKQNKQKTAARALQARETNERTNAPTNKQTNGGARLAGARNERTNKQNQLPTFRSVPFHSNPMHYLAELLVDGRVDALERAQRVRLDLDRPAVRRVRARLLEDGDLHAPHQSPNHRPPTRAAKRDTSIPPPPCDTPWRRRNSTKTTRHDDGDHHARGVCVCVCVCLGVCLGVPPTCAFGGHRGRRDEPGEAAARHITIHSITLYDMTPACPWRSPRPP